MGYLTLNQDLPNMNKATISVWFRIPTAAITARRAETPVGFWDFDVMLGVIPILAFGNQQAGTQYIWQTQVVGQDIYEGPGYSFTFDVYGTVLGPSHVAPMSPTWIGVFVGQTAFPQNPPILECHIQTRDIATGSGLSNTVAGYIPPEPDTLPITPGGTFIYRDTSTETLAAPVWFGEASISDDGEAEPDQWHHLLISWDLQSRNSGHGIEGGGSTQAGTTAASKMWCALDDKNLTELGLPALWIDGGGPNDILCQQVGRYAGSNGAEKTASVSFSPIPTGPLSIPAKQTYDQQPTGIGGEVTIPPTTEPVERIEMAELQIFCGVALDTTDPSSRRAFIDYVRDEKGEQVKDENGKNILQPINPRAAETFMRRRPDVLIHGTTNWKTGKNTGSLGVERTPDGGENIIPIGQFVPTGTIEKYLPDPSVAET